MHLKCTKHYCSTHQLVFMPSAHEKYGHTLTKSAVALCPELQLMKKPSAKDVHILKRKRDRQVRDQENTILAKIIPRQILGSSTAHQSLHI